MANAALNPIYERLNNAQAFHPLTAETFADWSMEAGDIVTISRDGNTYTSPVGTSRMVWRGSQQISIDSTGTKEREPISKVSRKKFSRGGGTANNNAFFYNEIFSDDGEVHSVVQQTASTFSVEVSKRARVFEYYEDPVRHGETVSPGDFWIKTNNVETWDEFTRVSWVYGSDFDWNDYKGALVYVRTEYNTWRMVSNQQILLDHSTKIDQDENHISLIAQDIQRIDGNVEKNYAELKVESDRISSEVISTRENLASRIDQTASSIRSEVSTLDGQLSSRITQTASSIRSEVSNAYEGLSSSITQTASSIRSEVSSSYDGLSSSITQTASSIRSEVSSSYDGLSSSITQTASSIRSEVSSSYDGLSSSITQTASSIRSEVRDSYEGLSSSITQTASSIRSEVSDSYSGLSTTITQTSSAFSVEVGKRARVFEYHEDPAKKGETVSPGDFWVQTNNVETWDEFTRVSWVYGSDFNWDDYKGAIVWVRTEYGTWRKISDQREMLDHSTKIDQDDDHISLIAQDVQRIDGNVQRNYSEFRVTSQAISADVIDTRNNLASNISQTASSIRSEVSTLDGQFSSRITQTASSIRSEVSTKEHGLSSSITQTASSIRSEVSTSEYGLSSSITQTASSIRSEVSTTEYGFSSSITQTASSIRSEVSTTEYGLTSSITQTASSIRSEVSSSYSGLSSSITQQSDRISLVVEGTGENAKIKPASIVAAINKGSSSVVISANHINLEGYTKADDLTSEYLTAKLANFQTLTSNRGGISVNSVGTKSFTQGGVSCYVPNAIWQLQITSVGDTYTLQRKRFNDDDWQDVGSFSRATSLSGAWSSSIYTVTASPQGDKWSIGFDSSAKEYLTVYGGAETPYTQGDTVNYNYLYKTIKIGTVNSGAAPTDRYTVDNILVDTSSIYSAGIASYYGSSYWGRPSSSNNYVCSVPNITNTASETWFDAKSLVSISGGWSGDTFTARANPGNKPYSTSLYSVNCTNVTGSSGTLGDKYVNATIRLAWDGDPDDGEASHTISKTVPVNAEIAYNKGYAVTHSQFSKGADPKAYSSSYQYNTNGKLNLGVISKSSIYGPGYLEVQCKVHGYTETMYLTINS